jgi:hypothetical protein
MLISHSILKGMKKHFTEGKKSNNLNTLIVLPIADSILSRKQDNEMAKEIIEMLDLLRDYGVGFLLSVEKQADLSSESIMLTNAVLSVVKNHDVGVHIKEKGNYRVKIRPTLSSL